MSNLIGRLLFLFALTLLFPNSSISAATWHVNKDGTGDTESIEMAVFLASSGDTVLVSPGTYYETTIYMSSKSVFLISEGGPETTIIRHLGLPGLEEHTVIDIMDNTTLSCVDGFTITGAAGGFAECGGAISIIRSNVIIRNNIITGNWCSGGAGICCSGNPSPTIENNLIYLNEAWVGGGIHMQNCSPNIRNNTIANNYADVSGGGIKIRLDSHPIIEHNIIVYNTSSQGGGVDSSTPDSCIVFSCNDVWSNSTNYYGQIADRTGIDGNISVDPMFCGEYGTGNYYLQSGSPCTEMNVSDICNAIRMGFYPIGCSVAAEKSSWGKIKSRK